MNKAMAKQDHHQLTSPPVRHPTPKRGGEGRDERRDGRQHPGPKVDLRRVVHAELGQEQRHHRAEHGEPHVHAELDAHHQEQGPLPVGREGGFGSGGGCSMIQSRGRQGLGPVSSSGHRLECRPAAAKVKRPCHRPQIVTGSECSRDARQRQRFLARVSCRWGPARHCPRAETNGGSAKDKRRVCRVVGANSVAERACIRRGSSAVMAGMLVGKLRPGNVRSGRFADVPEACHLARECAGHRLLPS